MIISGVHTENKLPSISFSPNLFEKNDTTHQFDETPFLAEQLTEENDQCEFPDSLNLISKNGTIFKRALMF